MELEEALQEYLDEAYITHSIYACEMSFYRDLTREEINFMNNHIISTGCKIICYTCSTCKENSNGKEKFHIDRVYI
jgi:hypothetical protein